ncbi:LysR family transcriptional regulator [Eikenella sp. S3360]|uniref:LysR family transcriptional regulator n=1 Tax=Eikenella glucosivorans TaxID=2766967 RepID=A0ABS0N9M9_9NEIS|nr:LysR family transcriptional regulator [Eikenella glucosivorans]MBH5328959.1 LysR family transcriptional regulator [Eikenella glucosivorans]
MDDLKPLLAFAAVLEHGSMNAAAQALGMTPSAVSQHISRLEKLHGVKLLHRSTRRLAPTDAGQVLGEHCRRLLATVRDTRLALSGLKTDIAGSVRLAAPTGLANAAAFRRALLRLSREHPALQIDLQLGEALADLREGGIDIALRGGEHALDAPELIARKLAEWPWRICAAPDYLKTAPPIAQPADLAAHRWVYHQPPQLELACGRERRPLSISSGLRCNQIAAVRPLCEAGLGLALIIQGEAADAVQSGSLQIVLPEWRLPAVALYAVTPHRIQSARIAAVLRILQESFAEPPAAAEAT